MKIDLMSRYPVTQRSSIISERVKVSNVDRKLAQKFDKEYFDGPRRLGMGGYSYNPKFFKPVVEDMIDYYDLNNSSSILDVGCAKGFMLYDFKSVLPNCSVAGLDISKYCLDNSMESVKPFLTLGSCDKLPYDDNSFDFVVSIATIHNLDINGVKKSLKEIMRVTKKNAFIKVNGYTNNNELKNLNNWNLVAKTILHENDWIALFNETGYTGDYFWFNT
ncbi:class I SAM-dependent methyltransferase [Candidatus Pseudothioglobus singularis]|nr:class I SAM-dependent methyltransferase [Candidatus Pseudothioglobus singularis]